MMGADVATAAERMHSGRAMPMPLVMIFFSTLEKGQFVFEKEEGKGRCML
jgi:hypothetical protein